VLAAPFWVTPPVPVIFVEIVDAEPSSRSSVPLSAMPLAEAMVPLVVPLPSCRLAPLLIVVAPVKVLVPVRISVPVPASVRLPVPEMTPANVVEALLPPVVSVVAADPMVIELVALALAMEPTVLLSPAAIASTPLLLTVTALRLPRAVALPAVSVPPLTTVGPE
jgi:hypothetical protein